VTVDPFSLEGRTALVSGARRGIGAAIAAGYAATGAELILMARDAALEDTLEAIKQNGGEASVVIADFADPEAVEAAAIELARTRRIDILVNNAGTIRRAGGRDHDR
jgi:2-deoxy-D-gluconate 3-dehydrogenase